MHFLPRKTKGNLRKVNDLEYIFEIAATYDGNDELNRLVFAGKSVWNIASKLKKVVHGTEGIELLEKELLRNINEMVRFLRKISEFAEIDVKKRFDDIYFPETSGALKNLIDLGHDLAVFKDIQSQSRRQEL
ncbi:MAG: hypothetical protein IAE98_01675 [Candidatus Kapabacteria bacterium]|nr:hypothetical protein [Candidatus Kapabacteria bacterium]